MNLKVIHGNSFTCLGDTNTSTGIDMKGEGSLSSYQGVSCVMDFNGFEPFRNEKF